MPRTCRQRRVFAWAAVLAGAFGTAACGRNAASNAPDGGDGGPLVGGRRSFDVVAVLKGDASAILPPSNAFTLVIDADAHLAIAGGKGIGAVIPITGNGQTFSSTTPFNVGGDGGACSGPEGVRYTAFDIVVVGATLTGRASGEATISCGDCAFTVGFDSTWAGTADVTPPTLRAIGITPATPFDAFGLAASEPMPGSATARLVADDGTRIDLRPTVIDGEVPLVVGFSKPDVVLNPGHGYSVAFDGLVDFAGQTDPGGAPLQLTAFAAAPVVPEDGFESVTGGTFGGAQVVTTGPLPVIGGGTSLYIGPAGAPALDSLVGRSLTVRLARQAGDSVVRFSYRVVSLQSQPYFSGWAGVGSPGAPAGSQFNPFSTTTGTPDQLTIAKTIAYASPVAVRELPLPAEVTNEVLVVIAPNSAFCGPGFNSNAGLLIDDLRVE